MIPISFPIAHSPHPVNHLSYVSYLTLLLLGDDTPDVIPRHTMLRHTYHVSANRNFRPTPVPNRDFRPLIPPPLYASPTKCAPHHAWRGERSETDRRCRLPAPPPRPTAGFSTHMFHVKHARKEGRKEGNDHPRQPKRERSRQRLGCRTPSSCASARCARCAGAYTHSRHGACRLPAPPPRPIPTHSFHVKHASTDQPPARRPAAPRGLSCPRRERSLSVQSPPTPSYPLLPPPSSK